MYRPNRLFESSASHLGSCTVIAYHFSLRQQLSTPDLNFTTDVLTPLSISHVLRDLHAAFLSTVLAEEWRRCRPENMHGPNWRRVYPRFVPTRHADVTREPRPVNGTCHGSDKQNNRDCHRRRVDGLERHGPGWVGRGCWEAARS